MLGRIFRSGVVSSDAADHPALGLTARNVTMRFQGVTALDDVSIDVMPGEILGLVGPNGAGKTTLVNVLSGFQKPTAGVVILAGQDVTSKPPHKRARMGLTRTFQAPRRFASTTVMGNVLPGALGVGMRGRVARAAAEQALETVGLATRSDVPASDITHGEERLMGVARALATKPQVLLLDEPAAGLNDSESELLRSVIIRIRDDLHCGLLLIEHDFELVVAVSDRLHVLDYGRTIAVGLPSQVRNDPRVLEAYLGESPGVSHS